MVSRRGEIKKLSRRGDLLSCHGDLSSRHGEIVSHCGELISHRGELIILPRRLKISRRRDISSSEMKLYFLWHFWAPVLLFYISPMKYVALRVFHDIKQLQIRTHPVQHIHETADASNNHVEKNTDPICMTAYLYTHGYMSLWYNHASILWCACWDYE